MTTHSMVLFCGCMLLIASGCGLLQQQGVAEEALFIQGKVQHISLAENTLTIKPNKGKKMRFLLNKQTNFIGFTSLTEIKKKQRLKIWYTHKEEGALAVKIKKLQELGC